MVLKEKMVAGPDPGRHQQPVAATVVGTADDKESSQGQEGPAFLQEDPAVADDVADHGAVAHGGRVHLVAAPCHRVEVHPTACNCKRLLR